MQAVGVVAEYNPFHNGHTYHVQQAKKQAHADIVIVAISGHFLQRGEPALVDKWTRTAMALQAGVDIVIELPYLFSTASAQKFAYGGVALLHALRCHSIAFGSEAGELQPFLNSLSLIRQNRQTYEAEIQSAIQTGVSYPKAMHLAYEKLTQIHPSDYVDLTQPNNVLALHYIEAIERIQSPITPITFNRVGAHYYDELQYDSQIASATSIRKALLTNKSLQQIKQFLPYTSYTLLQQWQAKQQTFIDWEIFWPFLQHTIIRSSAEQLTTFADVTEGLQFSLLKHATNAVSFQSFMKQLKSKRYTWTRLQRMLTHIFTGITKEQLQTHSEPSYIRLLGMTEQGQTYLSTYKKQFSLPIISRVAAVKDDLLTVDIRATNMYQLGTHLLKKNGIGNDYTIPPIRI